MSRQYVLCVCFQMRSHSTQRVVQLFKVELHLDKHTYDTYRMIFCGCNGILFDDSNSFRGPLGLPRSFRVSESQAAARAGQQRDIRQRQAQSLGQSEHVQEEDGHPGARQRLAPELHPVLLGQGQFLFSRK